VTIILDIQNNEPTAELIINPEGITNPEQLAEDFLKLYWYVSSNKILNHLKGQLKSLCEMTNNDVIYKHFKEKFEVQNGKLVEQYNKPAINPLDVFRRLSR